MYYAAPHSSRIHYGAAAADATAASLHTKKTHHAPSLHPAAAAAAAPTYLHHHYEAAASSSRYAHSAVAPHRTSTPVRSTTPVRCVTPSRPTKPSSSGAVAAAHASTPSSSSFMTQAARGDVTPKAQISRAPSHAHTAPARRGGSLLPSTPLDRRMLLVLDMDETLLHADVSPVPHDVSFVVHMDNGSSTPVYVKFRPYLGRFLNAVSRLFEVVVFTASIPRYANQVLDYIDPSGELVHHRLFREHCTEVNGTYVKDLERLGRPLGRVAIVDNSPIAYTFHPENAVAIPSWYDCERDNALQRLLPHLERMARDEGVYDSLDDIRRELQWD